MSDSGESAGRPVRRRLLKSRRSKAAVIVSSIAVVCGAAFYWHGISGEFERARRLMLLGEPHTAYDALTNYLRFHAEDADANLLAAEILVSDRNLAGEEALPKALEHLVQIPDSSARSSVARVREGRIFLFLLERPGAAAASFTRAMKLDPNAVEPPYLMWKLLDLTGRSYRAAPHFRRAFELTPADERALRLREWFMSQFYPALANPELDRLMGIVGDSESPGALTELRRLRRFREAEPKAPFTHAMIARWFALEGDPKEALKLLRDALETTDEPLLDRDFVGTLVSVLFDLGEFDQAVEFFDGQSADSARPQHVNDPPADYEYWKWKATLDDRVRDQTVDALAAYDRAVNTWPGHADWRLQNLRVKCLIRAGKTEEADQARERAERIEALMEKDVQTRVRRALQTPNHPESARIMISFYEDLGLEYERKCWEQELSRSIGNQDDTTGGVVTDAP